MRRGFNPLYRKNEAWWGLEFLPRFHSQTKRILLKLKRRKIRRIFKRETDKEIQEA